MFKISATNVTDGYYEGLKLLNRVGQHENSRNGEVLAAPGPVLTEFVNPEYRVLNSALRDANPFFHVMEAIWMLAGRNDSAFVSRFVQRMNTFVDGDSGVLNGAYGHRWRKFFNFDQILEASTMLREYPESRRVVISMWSADDLNFRSKDIPCNTHIYFRVVNNMLDMTVCNRSNDIYWGLFGANAVHLSILHEVMAESTGYRMGIWFQFSNNFHLYPANLPHSLEVLLAEREGEERDEVRFEQHVPIKFNDLYSFLRACERFVVEPRGDSGCVFLDHVAFPMYRYWETRDDFWVSSIQDDEWACECKRWVDKRRNNESI